MVVATRILVDGDACPILDIIEQIAREFELELIIYSDIYHNLKIEYGTLVQVDKGFQEVDIRIVNDCQKNDLVITQDYGLAALVLGKGAWVLDFNGRSFTKENINYLLLKRHLYFRLRRSGGRHKGPPKRIKDNNFKFENSLRQIIITILGDYSDTTLDR